MTVIAYRDGIMAADGLSTSGLTVVSSRDRKIIRAPSGDLLGLAGDVAMLFRFLDQSRRFPDVDPPFNLLSGADGTSSWILIARQSGTLEIMTMSGREVLGKAHKYYAIGAGRDFALAAMDAGASAIEAVKIACKRNIYCGGRVISEKL